jgi:hypothetical protein
MDLMKLLRSFEEFLFEAASWLLFYPLTIIRIVAQPLRMMSYSDEQQRVDDDKMYDNALSPPLLLLITVAVVSLLDAALNIAMPTPSSLTRSIASSPQNLAIFRGLAFSLVPLVAAATLLRYQRIGLSRSALRPPFYAQCFLATPCALFLGVASAIIQRPEVPDSLAGVLTVAGAAWFLVAQTRWFAERLSTTYVHAAWISVWALVRAIFYLLLLLVPVMLV